MMLDILAGCVCESSVYRLYPLRSGDDVRGVCSKSNYKERSKQEIMLLTDQEDQVGVLVQSSGHTDPLSLPSTQVDALEHTHTHTRPS